MQVFFKYFGKIGKIAELCRSLLAGRGGLTRRRETVLEQLREDSADTDAFISLQSAMGSSRELMNTEYYAMRLMVEAKKLDPSELPEGVCEVELSEADQMLSGDGKIKLAQEMMSDALYQSARKSINDNVWNCVAKLLDAAKSQQASA